jgi:ferredoxin/flavodoxin---NADP+ reductase
MASGLGSECSPVWEGRNTLFPVHQASYVTNRIKRFWVDAPRVATFWQPGQFVIVRPVPDAERIPLTVVEASPEQGWISFVVQEVGETTARLNSLQTGDALSDVCGPLGRPFPIERYGTVVVIGGGVGMAMAFPIASALKKAGNRVLAVMGARTRDMFLLEDELTSTCDRLYKMTEDGSYGTPGLVTEVLEELLAKGTPIDLVVAVGPVGMMGAVADLTRPHGIPTQVSLNPIMIDGTGMCGGCRVVVGGERMLACMDGPSFDGHLVDFTLLASRNEAHAAHEEARRCAIGLGT